MQRELAKERPILSQRHPNKNFISPEFIMSLPQRTTTERAVREERALGACLARWLLLLRSSDDARLMILLNSIANQWAVVTHPGERLGFTQALHCLPPG